MNFVVNIVDILLTIFVGLGVKNQLLLLSTIYSFFTPSPQKSTKESSINDEVLQKSTFKDTY